MIRLQRRRGSAHIPKAFMQPKLAASAEKLVRIHYEAQQTGKYVFESSAWKPAKGTLKKDAAGKCAYCEASTEVVAHGDVEHFRPKSVYWWLAFAFDNYLFSCQICNQSYKGDKFPISGALAPAPLMPPAPPSGQELEDLVTSLILDPMALADADLLALWAAEDADLPNPYFEDPEPLFTWEADDRNREIWMRSAGGPRADRAFGAANTVLGINREELRRLRYADYRPFFMLWMTLGQLTPDLQQEVVRELRLQQGRRQPFAGMKRYFAKGWGLPGPLQ